MIESGTTRRGQGHVAATRAESTQRVRAEDESTTRVFDAVVSLCLPLAISDNVPLYPISLQSSQSRYNPARKRVNSVPFFGCFPPPVSWFPYISCSCRCPVSEDRGGFWRRRGEEELREAVVIEAVGGSGDPAASFLVWDARVIWSVPGLGIRNGMAVQDGAEARIAGKPDASSSYLHKFRLYETRSIQEAVVYSRSHKRLLFQLLIPCYEKPPKEHL
ncbi:hypothetical protein BHE74_00059300 [Ensete ventricosum]|nr:hypothetical protein BHE74_00059300 [Ensete ventricosum]